MSQHISNLPVGAKVKFGRHSINGEAAQDITWLIVAKNHKDYTTNSVTLLTEKVIDVRCFDAREMLSDKEECRSGGNNLYSRSNIHCWLTSNANALYVEWSNNADEQSPSGGSVVYGGAEYAGRPGFLNLFTAEEQFQILTTSLQEWAYNGSKDVIPAKVFLPNPTEVGITSDKIISSGTYEANGTTWEYFTQIGSHVAYPTDQVLTYSTTSYWSTLGGKDGDGTMWLTRGRDTNTYNKVWCVNKSGKFTKNMNANYCGGIRPALNLSSAAFVSDTTDNDGCYVVLTGIAPSAPSPLSVPTIMGGGATTISWGSVIDSAGGVITYELQCSVNGGEYSTLYSGTRTSHTHVVEFGTRTVQYRVRATGSNGISGEYTVSNVLSVINNNPPVISGSDRNLGTLTEGVSVEYTVTDAEESGTTISVIESLDGVAVRTHSATLGQKYTFAITGEEWLKVGNGSHTLTITAIDVYGSTSRRNYTFNKSVTRLTIQTRPMEADTMPTLLALTVTRSVPTGAIFKAEACNNGNDASPVWEDVTIAVEKNLIYSFTNLSKTATNWAVMVRVTLDRNNSVGACYVSAIGGNFE